MNWPNLLYTMPLVLAASLSAPLALHSWRRRATPGATPLAAMALAVFVWTGSLAMYHHAKSDSARVFWSTLLFAGIAVLPPAWLAFSLRYTVRQVRFGKAALILATTIGIVMVALVATNGWHWLVWHDVVRNGQIHSEPTVIYVIFVVYGQLLSIAGIANILERTVASGAAFRKQRVIMIVAGLIPILTSLLFQMKIILLERDPTPLVFFISITLIWWALFRFELLDLMPVAQSVLLNTMKDGMLVIDARERIQNANRAALGMLEGLTPDAVGRPAGEGLKRWAELREICRPQSPGLLKVMASQGPQPKFFEASATPIIGSHGRVKGYLLLFRDVTERHLSDLERDRLIAELQAALGQVKTLKGLLPICAGCKRIRDRDNRWHPMESYLAQYTNIQLSHGLCPDCLKELYPDY